MKKLTILIHSVDAVGHFNACIGIGQPLRERGHKVVFAVTNAWRNKMIPQGFFEEPLEDPAPEETEDEGTGENKLHDWQEIVRQMAPSFSHSPVEQISSQFEVFLKELTRKAKLHHPRLLEIVERIKPDVIIVDALIHQPAVMNAGIPWIFSTSVTPASICTKNVPPAYAGYSTKGADPETFRIHHEKYRTVFRPIYDDICGWLAQNGGPQIKFYDSSYIFVKYSPYANIYMYPEELDYAEFRPNPPKFHRFDAFIRSSKERFEIPEKLKNKPGKLIFLSMGSIGCSELGLMKRLVSIFAKSPNRFIVSRGPLAEEYELADNMWGESFLPQPAILPIVDLVISHGGNNTVTETLYFGKPLLVLPLFGDQPDNGQRVMEAGLGLRRHPYKNSEQELLDAVETLLANDKLAAKLAIISKRIQGSNHRSRLADLVESVATSEIIT